MNKRRAEQLVSGYLKQADKYFRFDLDRVRSVKDGWKPPEFLFMESTVAYDRLITDMEKEENYAIEGLALSVAKFRFLATYLRESGKTWAEVNTNGQDTCPLCAFFLYSEYAPRIRNCAGCPVRNYTGEARCWETPYELFEEGYGNDERLDLKGTNKWADAADREADFLYKVLLAQEE